MHPQKKVRVCVRLILVLVWKNCLGFSVGYVYGQSTVYLCLSKYIVVQTQTGEGVPIQPAA